MKFEKQFPSLTKRDRDKRIDGSWMDHFYVHLFVEGGMDDSSSHAKSIEEAEYVFVDSVKKHCLDKQKVKKVIENYFEKEYIEGKEDKACITILKKLGVY